MRYKRFLASRPILYTFKNMPYWFETKKIKLPPGKDRRRKLSEKDYKKIRQLAKNGYSQRDLAQKFNVSRRLIVFILYPERIKKHNWRDYYDRKKHTLAMRKHRKHKKEVLGLSK